MVQYYIQERILVKPQFTDTSVICTDTLVICTDTSVICTDTSVICTDTSPLWSVPNYFHNSKVYKTLSPTTMVNLTSLFRSLCFRPVLRVPLLVRFNCTARHQKNFFLFSFANKSWMANANLKANGLRL